MTRFAHRSSQFRVALLAASFSVVTACGGSSSTPAPPVVPPAATYTATSGVAQKGPLILGSTVIAQELDSSLSPTGKQYSYQITSDLGTFSPTSTFGSQFIGLNATGYYFDEVQNAVSSGPITLNGYSDLTTSSVLNVNLLTTLAYQRIQHLIVTSGMTFAAARTQAENEVLTALNIPTGSYGTFGTLDLAGGTDGDNILAAISSIFVYGNASGPLTQLVATFQADVGANGAITVAATKSALAAAAQAINPAVIASNLTQKYSSVGATFTAADISDWIDQDGDGLIGKFKFQVRLATSSSVFIFPSYVVSQVVGAPVTTSAGQLFVNGNSAISPVTINSGDVITVSPSAAGLPNGMLTSYLLSGTSKIARVDFAAEGSWHSAGSLAQGRHAHTATLLANGKVLIAAGASNTCCFASAELYDPTLNTWSAAGSLVTARNSHTATLLSSGKVLVTGGSDQSTFGFASTELYDPAANSWSPAASLATGRVEHTATLLTSGKVLVVGGINSGGVGLTSAELYDPATNTWSAAGSLAIGRYLHSATLMPNGTVLVAGGDQLGTFTGLASAELYDPAANTWSRAGSPAIARFGHTATLLQSGRVLVAGGTGPGNSQLASAELYDPVANTWSSAASMSTARVTHTATLLPEGKVLVVGGMNATPSAVASSELYDPAMNTWLAAAMLPTARVQHAATLLQNGAVLIAGGDDGTIFLVIAEYYY
jgi:N-acetylneuraminic acid mutarotase